MITKIKNWLWPEEKCHPIYQTLLGFWHGVEYDPVSDDFLAWVSDDGLVRIAGAGNSRELALEDAFNRWKVVQ